MISDLVRQASEEELQGIIQAAIHRHKELYPDWDLMVYTLHDCAPELYVQDIDMLIEYLRSLQRRKMG